jgi:hypothetical protein
MGKQRQITPRQGRIEMKIEDGIIYFKSEMPFFWKEYTGKKNNIVRKIPREELVKYNIVVDNDIGIMYYTNPEGKQQIVTDIKIDCGDSKLYTDIEIFRDLIDVSEFSGNYIFTWDA